MEIIDSHVHVLEYNTAQRPWRRDGGAIRTDHVTRTAIRTYAQTLATLNETGVAGALLISTSHYGWQNTYAFEAARHHPERFRVVARIDHSADDVEETVACLKANGLCVALRVLIMDAAAASMIENGEFDRLFCAAAHQRMPVCIYPPNSLRSIEFIAHRFDSLSIVIDHLGMPRSLLESPVSDPFSDFGRLLRLGATAAHVAVKLSAIPTLSTQAFPFKDLFKRLHLLLRAFGPERIMWGSDWTRTEQFYSYAEGLHYITQSNELNYHEKSLILGKSLRNLFSWPP